MRFALALSLCQIVRSFSTLLAPNAFLYRFVIAQKEITLALFVLWLHFFDRELVAESGLWPPFFLTKF